MHTIKKGFSLLNKAFSIFRIVFIIISIYFIVISLFLHFAKEDQFQTSKFDPIKETRKQIYSFIRDEKLNSTKEGREMIKIYRTMFCAFIGEACTDNPNDGDKNFQYSLLGKATNLLSLPYSTPPASGIAWTANTLANVGLVPKTLAAPIGGIGLNAILPIYPVWKAFRNLAYLAIVLVLLTIGFMIMMRKRINPQTVITIENSLPKIVTSMILIALSFPIAGFLIDLMYGVSLLIIFMLVPEKKALIISTAFLNGNIWNLTTGGLFSAKQLAVKTGEGLLAIMPELLRDSIHLLSSLILTFITFKLGKEYLAEPLSGLLKGFSAGARFDLEMFKNLASTIIGLLIILVSLIATLNSPQIVLFFLSTLVFFSIIATIVKLFILLLYSYLRIVLYIILAPAYILLDALPGKSGFQDWLRSLFVELTSWPLTMFFIIIPSMIIKTLASQSKALWTPPFIFSIQSEAVAYLVGGGLFFMAPGFIRQVKKSLGAKKPPLSITPRTILGGGGTALSGLAGLIHSAPSFTQLLPGGMYTAIQSIPWLGKTIAPESLQQQVAKEIAKLREEQSPKEGGK